MCTTVVRSMGFESGVGRNFGGSRVRFGDFAQRNEHFGSTVTGGNVAT